VRCEVGQAGIWISDPGRDCLFGGEVILEAGIRSPGGVKLDQVLFRIRSLVRVSMIRQL
jgi:hypothetical protein